jgi:aryl-alcohol dehydrogenase-like predicted oxidoreductase
VLYRRLGRTGLRVSTIGLGGWQLGGEWGRAFSPTEADRLVGRAHDLGVNLIDTAECYGDHESERLAGRAIRRDRAGWIVCTKFGHRFRGHLDREPAFDVAGVAASLRGSLAALGTDYIDLLLFHSGTNEQITSDELWTFLQGRVRAGAVRHVGLSLSGESPHSGPWQAQRARALGASVVQVVYNRLRPDAARDVFPICARDGLGVVTRVPLAQGLLAGRIDERSTFAPTDLRHRWSCEQLRASVQRVRAVWQREKPAHVDPVEWAIAWSVAADEVSATVVGCKTPNQIEAAVRTVASGLVRADHPLACPHR